MRNLTRQAPERLLEGLSDPQRQAVTHTDGPLLILAGPGSGKTRVVTRRAAHLACTVTDPHRILAITFTNKAAREMQDRIDALGVSGGMTVSTFHAFCARILRIYHDRAGISRDYTIFDRDDRRKVIKRAVEVCELSTSNWSPARIDRVISNAKNAMQTAADFAANHTDWEQRTLARIYTAYEQLLSEMNGLDFDDLLMRVAMLLATDAPLRDELEDRYQYVLIDEYQDTNAAQYDIARLLTTGRHNICATGDPDQSIYGWRGADIKNILSFERDYPDAVVVRLEQNYRSTKHILAAADALIAGNVNRKEKTLWTENEQGEPVRIVETENGIEEAATLAQTIRRHIDRGVDPGDVAVFYRVNSLSRVIEEAFLHEGIRYQIARGVEFYNRKEIKDVLAYLRVLINPADEIALLRVINTPPRGIGATTIDRFRRCAGERSCRLTDLLADGVDLSQLGRSSKKVVEFGRLLQSLSDTLHLPASEAIDAIISQSGLRAHYAAAAEMDAKPIDNLDELISAAATFEQMSPGATVRDWLEHTALLSDVDAVKSEGGLVTLMTLHAAKGLEFPVVFIIGLEDGLLPLHRDDDPDPEEEEEERRLCFVGITRAKKHLTLSRARYRMLRGVSRRTVRSPFLDELPPGAVEWRGATRVRGRAKASSGGGRLPDDIAEWTVGTLVRHPIHGLGQILSFRRGATKTHVDVQFQGGPRKQWILEHAPLERVDFEDVG